MAYPGGVPHSAKSHLGDLERAVMDVLWGTEPEQWLTVREVYAALVADREIAYTTVMTVLDRLARKGVTHQRRDGRAYSYRPRVSRAELTAELMHDALSDFTGRDRGQALVAFVGEASNDDVAALRIALARLEEQAGADPGRPTGQGS